MVMSISKLSPVRFAGSGLGGKTTVVIWSAASPKDMRLATLDQTEHGGTNPHITVLGRANTPSQFAKLMAQHQPDTVLLGSRIDEDPQPEAEMKAENDDEDAVMQDFSSFSQLKAWAQEANPHKLPGVVAMTCKQIWRTEAQPFQRVMTVDMSSRVEKIVRALRAVDPTEPPSESN